MKILLIDNFDSFTYNIVDAYRQLHAEVEVRRNHAITTEEILANPPDLLIIGPGPGNPDTAGVSKACVSLAQQGIAIFGLCLGHQVIASVFGASIVRAPYPMHGKLATLRHMAQGLFAGVPQGIKVTRYHSLLIKPETLPLDLEVTAWAEDQAIMAIAHRHLPIWGVQFHPESAASEHGLTLFNNTLYIRKSEPK